MRINVYSQELTDEVKFITKDSNTGKVYHAAQLMLRSADELHNSPDDDDRSAVTFWLPSSSHRLNDIAEAFDKIADRFREAAGEALINEHDAAPVEQLPYLYEVTSVAAPEASEPVPVLSDAPYQEPVDTLADFKIRFKAEHWAVKEGTANTTKIYDVFERSGDSDLWTEAAGIYSRGICIGKKSFIASQNDEFEIIES